MKYSLCIVMCCSILSMGQSVISNKIQPSGAKKTIVFEEDLRIGEDCSEDHCLWSGSQVGVSIAKDGTMFVSDSGGNRVVVYSSKGEFLKTLGRKGQGPGEFNQLYSYQILDDQSAVAFDNDQNLTSFSFFDQNHTFLNKVTTQPGKLFIQSAYFSPDGTKVASMYVVPNSDPGTPGVVTSGFIDPKTDPLLAITQGPQVMFDQNQMNDKAWWAGFLADWFKVVNKGIGVMAFGSEGRVYAANTNDYSITEYDADLKPVRIIKKTFKPIPMPEEQLLTFVEPVYEEITSILPPELRQVVTPSVVKKALELAEFPPRKQPIYGLLPVENQGLLVIHNHNPLTRETTADFFSIAGEYLGPVTLPPIHVNIFAGFFGSASRIIFQNGYAYTILLTESGDRHLVRYKYRIENSGS